MLVEFLHECWKIFAWCPSDMLGVPRELVKHALNVDRKERPVKQPLRRFDEPRCKAIAAELHRLDNVGFIREIKTSTWVSNPVIIPKKNTNVHRLCVDYMSLNKHCRKDPFPLPHIDQIIDSTAGCARLSFMDAYSGYNQIKLKKEDK
jgi:putative transposase